MTDLKRLDVSGIQTSHSTGNLLHLKPFVFNYTFGTGTVSCHSVARGPGRRAPVLAGCPVRIRQKQPANRPSPDRRASSDPAPRSMRRIRRRGAVVPGELPAGPLRTGPNDPTATPAPHRLRGGVPHPETSPAVAVARRRYRPL